MNTQILLDHEPVADGGDLVRALLRITGAAPEAAARLPLSLALVLDRSGSMQATGSSGRLDSPGEVGCPRSGRARHFARRAGNERRDDDVISTVVDRSHLITPPPAGVSVA